MPLMGHSAALCPSLPQVKHALALPPPVDRHSAARWPCLEQLTQKSWLGMVCGGCVCARVQWCAVLSVVGVACAVSEIKADRPVVLVVGWGGVMFGVVCSPVEVHGAKMLVLCRWSSLVDHVRCWGEVHMAAATVRSRDSDVRLKMNRREGHNSAGSLPFSLSDAPHNSHSDTATHCDTVMGANMLLAVAFFFSISMPNYR